MKRTIIFVTGLFLTSAIHAEQQPTPVEIQAAQAAAATNNPSPTTAPTNNSSFAVTLARQAGLIAGAAQACGQDISLLSARLDEAILASATSTGDISDAVAAYQQSVKDTAEKQTSEQTMPCEMVLKDYQKLPLLRDDYKEVVISSLNADRAQKAVQSPTPAQLGQPQPTPPKTTP
jgi:hypothetical protein